ncbi:MAG: MATE family efflux transporter, partial [Mucinivorans sp.]
GTSGFTAQAYGARDFALAVRTLLRALSVAFAIALFLLALQLPIELLSMEVMHGSGGVERWASEYFFVRIWAAPATLGLYALKGWFIGMQNAKTPMWIAIVINVVNVLASLFFAFTLNMGLCGVALGTVVAQWSGLVMGLLILFFHYGRLFRGFSFVGLYDSAAMASFFRVNRDIFIRTICLVSVFTYFTIASSQMGDTVLAANTLMLQLFTLFSYMMDGFAYAGESLAGRYYGARNGAMLALASRRILLWGLALSLVVTVVYVVCGQAILSLFNPSEAILAVTRVNIWWAVAIPLMGFMAFLMDGLLVGITQAALMRNAMVISTAVFFMLYFLLTPVMGNHALWLSFLIYIFLRGVLQLAFSVKMLFHLH